MFNLLPPLDVGDPKEFLAATIATFAAYPVDVMEAAVPKIAHQTDRSTLKVIKAVCDEIYAPIERQIERDRVAANYQRGLPAPRKERTPEQQARIDEQVASARSRLGIPKGGAAKRGAILPPSAHVPLGSPDLPPPRRDNGHAARVAADLEQRRVRRASAEGTCGNG